MAKLVCIGDSLTQGSRSLATTDVGLSYPAMVAGCLGLGEHDFRLPDLSGAGGLPFNLEHMAREIQRRTGDDISLFEWPGAALEVGDLLREVEEYWERGPGNDPVPDALYHNLAVWDFQVGDAYNITPRYCREQCRDSGDDLLQPPSNSRLRNARRVLNPARLPERDDDTQVAVARRIAEQEGGIEHLVVSLGANNCLLAVLELDIRETGDTPPGVGSDRTLWSEAAFAAEYEELVRQVATIGATNVYLATVPHVTILPLVRGINTHRGELEPPERYFDWYAPFWVDEARFDPEADKHLTREQAVALDERVDAYNRTIRRLAGERGWPVVDLCGLIDDLAVRRNHGSPRHAPPPELADLDCRFAAIDPDSGRLAQGGLISLDGMHPTVCGYSLFARELLRAIRDRDPDVDELDFAAWRALDTLVGQPPRTLHDLTGMLATLERFFHVSRWMKVSDEHGIVIGG